jgi:hypothetical protein
MAVASWLLLLQRVFGVVDPDISKYIVSLEKGL